MVNYPDVWTNNKIKKIATIKTGSRDTQDNKINGKFPFFVRSPIIERINFADYNCEAVLTAGDGVGTGKVFHYFDGEFSAHQRVYVMNDFNEVTGKYFFYYFSRYFYHQVEKYTAKSSVDSVRRDMIAEMDISYPSLPEQKKIVEIIENFDLHVKNLSELITKMKMIRGGAIEDLVNGKTRLSGFDEDWISGEIKDILQILHGKNQKSVESLSGKYPILGTGGVVGRTDEFLCDWECVLIGRKGTIDTPFYMDTPFWTIDTLYYSLPRKAQHPKFQYYLFLSIDWKKYAESSGRPSLTRKTIESIPVLIPEFEEQKAIAEILTAMDKEIQDLEDEKLKLEQIREGALDDLLTGRVRLK